MLRGRKIISVNKLTVNVCIVFPRSTMEVMRVPNNSHAMEIIDIKYSEFGTRIWVV